MYTRHSILSPLFVEKDDKVFIVSDLHLGHVKDFLWNGRSQLYSKYVDSNITFNSVEEYSNYILNELRKLGESYNGSATLISLGDVSLNDNYGIWANYFAELPFKDIFSLKGNHASGLNEIFKAKQDNFTSDNKLKYKKLTLIDSCTTLRVNKNNYLLSHYPIYDWDMITSGCLCGHCHGKLSELNEDDSSLGKIFDCGVENAVRLFGRCYFSLEEVISILDKKKDNKESLHQTYK